MMNSESLKREKEDVCWSAGESRAIKRTITALTQLSKTSMFSVRETFCG